MSSSIGAVRAKFRVISVNRSVHGSATDEWVQVGLSAVGSDRPEDQAFWEATPNGRLDLVITREDAQKFFTLGDYFYLDFTPAG